MLISLHKNATTTPATRLALQQSTAPIVSSLSSTPLGWARCASGALGTQCTMPGYARHWGLSIV